MPNLQSNARILIVRLSAIGDVIHTLPTLNALRERLPDAFLAWIVEEKAADLLRGHRALDELIVLRRRWWRSPSTVLALRHYLRKLRFDITIDAQGLSKSSIPAWMSGARRRIGFDGDEGREVSRWFNNELVLPKRSNVVERNLDLLESLGIRDVMPRFDFTDAPSDARTADEIIQSRRLQPRFALINPGAGWESKRWPRDRYASVARHLGRRHAMDSLVVWAGDEERGWAEEIVAGSDGFANLAPATKLNELAALARRATLFVGSDSAPLHVASAVGTPCVVLFGPSSGVRNGPYGTQHVVVQQANPPRRTRQERRSDCGPIEAISVVHVADACDQVLSRKVISRRSA